jgi:hypothetical protein
MNDVERWVHLEGPEPEGIRELMDAGREVPDLTPEQAERMRRSFLKALAAQRRKRGREQKAKWALAAGLLAAGAAAVVMIALRWATPHELPGASAAVAVLSATGSSATGAAAAADSPSVAPWPPASGSSRRPGTQPLPDPGQTRNLHRGALLPVP